MSSSHALPELVVDLQDRTIADWNDLWDALSEPLALPTWFGRNLDAWWDTIQGRQIADIVDAHYLVILLPANHFLGRHGDGCRFVETTNDSDFARASFA